MYLRTAEKRHENHQTFHTFFYTIATIYSTVYCGFIEAYKNQVKLMNSAFLGAFFFFAKSVMSTAATAKIYKEKQEASGFTINFFPS